MSRTTRFTILALLTWGVSFTGCSIRAHEDSAKNGAADGEAQAPKGEKDGGGGALPGDLEESGAGAPNDEGAFPGGTGAFPGGTGGFPGGSDATGPGSGATNSGDTSSTAPQEPQCDESSPVTLFLSPDDSNSMSSPAQVKERLLVHRYQSLSNVPIRPWEFFNYYDFSYPEPEQTLGATLELSPIGDEAGHYHLQIGVRSQTWTYENRPQMNLTFVLDTSGSMAGPSLDMLKASVRAMSSQLRANDRVSVLTWSVSQSVLLDSHVISTAGDPRLTQLVDGLSADGGTDLHAGLTKGYELAQKNFQPGAINRLILISDGGANVGLVSKDLIARHASDAGKDGIYLAGVGVGTESSYNDALMDTVTDVGKGASVFVHNQAEAQRVFGDHFLSTLGLAAKNVRVQLDLPPGYELVTFSGEEASSDPTEVEPQHLGPNDSMVFHQEIKNCAPHIVDPNATIKVTLRYQDARTHQPGEVVVASTFAQLSQTPSPSLQKGTALTYFVDALTAHREARLDAPALITKAKDTLRLQISQNPGDPQLQELLDQLMVLAP